MKTAIRFLEAILLAGALIFCICEGVRFVSHDAVSFGIEADPGGWRLEDGGWAWHSHRYIWESTYVDPGPPACFIAFAGNDTPTGLAPSFHAQPGKRTIYCVPQYVIDNAHDRGAISEKEPWEPHLNAGTGIVIDGHDCKIESEWCK